MISICFDCFATATVLCARKGIMEKILLALAFAVLAAADVNELSEEVTGAVTSTEVPNMGICNLANLSGQAGEGAEGIRAYTY